MKYYKKINLKCVDAIKNYVLNNSDMNISSAIVKLPEPLLKTVNDELNSYGISNIWYSRYYANKKNNIQYIHIDGKRDLTVHCAINIPIIGGQGSKFSWYQGDYDVYYLHAMPTNQKIVGIDWKSESKIADSVEMVDGCYLVRVDAPHSAIASPLSDRLIFTMRFQGNPTFEEIYKLFDDAK